MSTVPAATLFHASPKGDITAFRAGSHFGLRDAAVERSKARKFSDQEMTLYEVEIAMENPLMIFDEGGSHTVEYLVGAIRDADRKALNRLACDAILTKAETEGEEAAITLLIDVMAGGRYDGLVYENNAEGAEGLSWITFNPEQVQIVSIEPLRAVLAAGM